MAEAPAPAKGGDKKKEGGAPVINGFWPLATEALFVGIIVYALWRAFNGGWNGVSWETFLTRSGLLSIWDSVVSTYVFLASVLSVLFLGGAIYAGYMAAQLEREWKAAFYPSPESVGQPAEEKPKNDRWVRVIEHINSDAPSDWRLAILECDIMLSDMLDREGYLGGTIGEKLKVANRGDFQTLDYAWEAHKIRNAIAHEGQDFELTPREARRVVGLYETVFREFDYI